MVTGFAGGMGCAHRDACGALSAGIMIIGARYGRTQPGVDDSRCQSLAARYQDRFAQTFGTTCCQELRPRYKPCTTLVEQAALLLLGIIES
jgi:C_GCAxxG_C_C family probable redox protein